MAGIISIIVLLSIGWICFCIYFFVKSLGFVMNATNLYRVMIARQESIIGLLLDIRDSTKNTNINPDSNLFSENMIGVGSQDMSFKAVNGDDDLGRIVQAYKQIKSQYGSDLSDAGILIKLEETLKIDSDTIKAAIARYGKDKETRN